MHNSKIRHEQVLNNAFCSDLTPSQDYHHTEQNRFISSATVFNDDLDIPLNNDYNNGNYNIIGFFGCCCN